MLVNNVTEMLEQLKAEEEVSQVKIAAPFESKEEISAAFENYSECKENEWVRMSSVPDVVKIGCELFALGNEYNFEPLSDHYTEEELEVYKKESEEAEVACSADAECSAVEDCDALLLCEISYKNKCKNEEEIKQAKEQGYYEQKYGQDCDILENKNVICTSENTDAEPCVVEYNTIYDSPVSVEELRVLSKNAFLNKDTLEPKKFIRDLYDTCNFKFDIQDIVGKFADDMLEELCPSCNTF